MSITTTHLWGGIRTDESREVERLLRAAGFEQVDAYRYNPASIRLRVIDRRFEGLSHADRDAMVEPHLKDLPERIRVDIMSLFTFAPSELQEPSRAYREFLLNAEFEEPSPSIL